MSTEDSEQSQEKIEEIVEKTAEEREKMQRKVFTSFDKLKNLDTTIDSTKKTHTEKATTLDKEILDSEKHINRDLAETKAYVGLIPRLEQLRTQLQQYQKEVTDLSEQASQCIRHDVNEAYELFDNARKKVDLIHSIYEEIEQMMRPLCKTDETLREAYENMKQQNNGEKAMLIVSVGDIALLLGRLNEAQESFKQALSLFEEVAPVKITLLEGIEEAQNKYIRGLQAVKALPLVGLAIVFQKKGQFSEAKRYYKMAFDEYNKFEAWNEATQTLSLIATCALAQGNRAEYIHSIDEAIAFAQAHGLPDWERKMKNMKTSSLIDWDVTGEFIETVREEIKTIKRGFRQSKGKIKDENVNDVNKLNEKHIDTLLLDSQSLLESGAIGVAELRLQKALNLARASDKRGTIHEQLAETYELQEQIEESIRNAEKAFQIALRLGIPDTILGALQTLVFLRLKKGGSAQFEKAASEIEIVIKKMSTAEYNEYLAQVLLQRAFLNFNQQKAEAALEDIEKAEKFTVTPELHQIVLVAKTATLNYLGRKEEALVANLQIIDLLKLQILHAGNSSPAAWHYKLNQIEELYESAALLAADLRRIRKAFEYSENGKAWLLRNQLTQTAVSTNRSWQAFRGTFEELHTLLEHESAAMVQFCVAGERTLGLVLDPKKREPQQFFIDLGDNDLKTMLPTGIIKRKKPEKVKNHWNDVIRDALPKLSEKFMPKLCDVVKHCDMLYLVPDSRLFSVPFAALTSKDGTPLVEHCALAYAPSAAVLEYCFSRRIELRERTCLAVGIDKDQGISFAEQARDIAELGWANSKWLPEATKEEFLDIVRNYTVVHLSCHGRVEETVQDMLSASYLKFAYTQELTARDIFNFNGQLNADLVFLNACMSGRFRLHLGSEVGGFWQGFLHAGASSIIATLSYLNPTFAHELALEFYRQWLSGNVTKAEALRRAQLHICQEEKDPLHWASHILIGDYR